MRNYLIPMSFVFAAALLAGCSHPLAYAPAPDTSIKLVKDSGGKTIAVAPECPDWRTNNLGPWQNEQWPQFGCANVRNLAAMIERPEDLEQGREMSPALGDKATTSMRRYSMEKTLPLIDPNAKNPVSNAGAALGQDTLGAGGMSK